jgi:hypothetical protein
MTDSEQRPTDRPGQSSASQADASLTPVRSKWFSMPAIKPSSYRRAILALIILAIGLSPLAFDQSLNADGGEIFIHGPQIYTRERLVNDRYLEDSWLNAMLEESTKVSFGHTQALHTNARDRAALGAGTGRSPSPDVAASQQQSAVGEANVGVGRPPDVSVPPTYQLQSRRAYRDRIRSMLVENQLDDRHDLHGNTLFRLHFDATILPSLYSRSAARIEISFNRPSELKSLPRDVKSISLDEIRGVLDTWEHLYGRWLYSIELRLNESANSLARRYETSKFSPDEYDALLAKLKSTIGSISKSITLLPDTADWGCRARKASAQQMLEEATRRAKLSLDLANLWTDSENNQISDFRDAYARGLTPDAERDVHSLYRRKIETLVNFRRAISPLVASSACATGVLVSQHSAQSIISGIAAPTPLVGLVPELTDREELRQLIYLTFWAKIYSAVTGVDDVPFVDGLRELLGSNGDYAPKSLSPYAIVRARPYELNAPFQVSPRSASIRFSRDDGCIRSHSKGEVTKLTASTMLGLVSSGGDLFTSTQEFAEAAVYARELMPNVVSNIRKTLLPKPLLDGQNGQEYCYENSRTETVPAGLFNFVGRLRKATTIYTYAINPSEPDELIGNRARTELVRELDAGMALKALSQALPQADVLVALKKEMVSELRRDSVQRQVFGYGKDGSIESGGAMLGWQVMPLDTDVNVSRPHLAPKQIPMTALVSLPAWWDRVEFQVNRKWIDRLGREIPIKVGQGEVLKFAVELPTNFETMDALLFDAADNGPVIVDWQIPQLLARPCAPFAVTVIGRRLWRSTVVTMGSVRASRVTVMPNMNGIIAEFNELPIPPSAALTDRRYFAPLTVWTSQGHATLPRLIEYARLERVPDNLRCMVGGPPN